MKKQLGAILFAILIISLIAITPARHAIAQQVINGYRIFVAVTAPSTPAAGTASVYVDSTSKKLCNKDDAGVVSCTGGGIQVCQLNQQSNVTLSTVANTFTTIISCTLPANLFATNNTCIRAAEWHHISANGFNATNYQWKFGATANTSAADTATTAPSSTSSVVICENGTNTQQMMTNPYFHGGTVSAPSALATPAETTSGTITLLLQAACSATCATAPTITPDMLLVDLSKQ